MPKIQVTIVPRQIGQIFDDILDGILNDLVIEPVSHGEKPLQQLIKHHYYPSYNLYQGFCYKQHTPNLCGYHATYNALCVLHLYLNMKSQYILESAACFWQFKKKVEKFLLQIKVYNKLGDTWPWREKDIMTGDFERTYNNICVDFFDDFDVFKEDRPNFEYMSFTWEFQYQNLLLSENTRWELNQKIAKFQKHKGSKPLIFGVMLAITGHWTLFMAFKRNGQAQYWHFDSHNRLKLDLNQQQIQEHINELNLQRTKSGRQKMTSFSKDNYAMSIKDIQVSCRLLIQCLEGKTTIEKYTYNQVFNIFAKHLHQASFSQENPEAKMQTILKDYWHNVCSFFRNPIKWDLLTPQSQQKMKMMINMAEHYRKGTFYEGRSLYDMIRKNNPRTMF